MKKLVRSLSAGFALALPLAMTAASPASAAEACVFVITGSGTISPGLSAVPTPQSISFTGTMTCVGTSGVGTTYPCSFTGTDPVGSEAAGAGQVSGNCGPYGFPSCQFVRVGVAVEVVCVDVAGTRVATATCVFTPVDVNPTTKYNLVCAGEYVDVP